MKWNLKSSVDEVKLVLEPSRGLQLAGLPIGVDLFTRTQFNAENAVDVWRKNDRNSDSLCTWLDFLWRREQLLLLLFLRSLRPVTVISRKRCHCFKIWFLVQNIFFSVRYWRREEMTLRVCPWQGFLSLIYLQINIRVWHYMTLHLSRTQPFMQKWD
jgi:hypothetical protein